MRLLSCVNFYCTDSLILGASRADWFGLVFGIVYRAAVVSGAAFNLPG